MDNTFRTASKALRVLRGQSLALQLTFEDVLQCPTQLTPGQKLRLLTAIAPNFEAPLRYAEGAQQLLQSLYGLWQDFGVEIRAEDIDAARQDMWSAFPRNDV